MLSDMHRRVSRLYDVLIDEHTISARATFLIDKNGILRHMTINDLGIPRNADELVRLVEYIENK